MVVCALSVNNLSSFAKLFGLKGFDVVYLVRVFLSLSSWSSLAYIWLISEYTISLTLGVAEDYGAVDCIPKS